MRLTTNANTPRALTLLLAAGALAVPACGQPEIAVGGVLNAASYARDLMPSSGIARGAMFVVFGLDLGTNTQGGATASYPLPVTLEGTSIRVTVNGTTVKAFMVYASQQQLTAILPSSNTCRQRRPDRELPGLR
jgi:uncharacterized protein (TIGR03437 family)